jgi:replicative DNA helicase
MNTPDSTNDRPLPFNPEIEIEVLACFLVIHEPNDLISYMCRIKQCDFYQPRHQEIYKAIYDLVMSKSPCDILSVSYALNVCDKLEFIGGDIYLSELMESIATTALLETRINQLLEFSVRRKAIEVLTSVTDDLYEYSNPLDSISEVKCNLESLTMDYTPKKHFSTIDTIRETNELINDCIDGHSDQVIPYCIPAIDCHIKHLRKQMHVLAANSGIGKTSLCCSAMRQQIPNGLKVILLCGESPRKEIMLRLASLITGKSVIWYLEGMPNATPQDIKEKEDALRYYEQFADNFWIYGKGDYEHSVSGMREVLRYIESRYGQLDMGWFDYLQNMKAPRHLRKSDNKTMITEYNVMEVNNIISDFNIAGVLQCQINREARKRVRPFMENLKYASAIENEAHIVTFLHRSKDVKMNDGILKTEWYSDKGRILGQIAASLAFHPERMEFTGYRSEEYKGDPALNANQKEE